MTNATIDSGLEFSGQEHNFNMYQAGDMDFAGGIYDFNSVMHYGNYAFSKNSKPTMLAIKDPTSLFGGKMDLSPTDIMQLNNLYDCKSKANCEEADTCYVKKQ